MGTSQNRTHPFILEADQEVHNTMGIPTYYLSQKLDKIVTTILSVNLWYSFTKILFIKSQHAWYIGRIFLFETNVLCAIYYNVYR